MTLSVHKTSEHWVSVYFELLLEIILAHLFTFRFVSSQRPDDERSRNDSNYIRH